MGNINQSFRNYLRALKDIYKSFENSSHEERKEFFRRIQKRVPYPFYKEYEYFFRKYYERGYFPFPFFFFPPDPKYWHLLEDNWKFPFEKIMRELEREFEVGENDNQEFSPGEKQISRDVQYLSSQFMKLTETSAKLEQEVFKISFIKDLPKNVVGHITEDGTLKLVEPETKKEWKIAILSPKEISFKENINKLIENNKGNKSSFIKELKLLLNEKNTH
ncbi:MAG: hypothetical protein U5R06_23510 [candidate division KSB1 bacterium]|nr:hypothetical protein [candidate division KSB1 bacterium]